MRVCASLKTFARADQGRHVSPGLALRRGARASQFLNDLSIHEKPGNASRTGPR